MKGGARRGAAARGRRTPAPGVAVRGVSVAVALAATLAGAPVHAAGQAPRSDVDALLRHTRVDSFLAGARAAFGEHVARMSTDLGTLLDVDRAASGAFADSLVLDDVAAWLAREGEAEHVRRAAAWLADGAAGRVESLTDSVPPGQSFEAFVEGLEATPPAPARVALVRRWAEARRAGEFVLLLDEAQREAAHRVAAAVDPDAPPFRPLAGEAFEAAWAQTTAFAVLSFLHRLQPVPDALLEAAVEEYESPSGQWLVEAYPLALAHAVREASRRVVAGLDAPPP